MILISTYTKQALAIVMIIATVLAAFPILKIHFGNQLTFSEEPGYYDSAFYLSIMGGGNNAIHYTLDGSEPTVNDPVFDKKRPLYIEDATNHPNVYSARTDTSTGFLTDLINQYAVLDAPGYMVPTYSVDKCTVIRASLFDSVGNCLNSVTGTYFVGFQEKNTCQNIYTVSLVTSPENLFNEDIGIYVTGNTFRQFQEEGVGKEELNKDALLSWCYWVSNYSKRGMDWERSAHITIFDNHHNMVLSQKCGIRIKGRVSRSFLPKSISCYARKVYDGDNRFNENIFQTDIFPHKIVLFGGSSDGNFKLKDYLVNVLGEDLHFSTMDFIPCAMFLDGEYWGMYYLTDDYNAEYIHDHYQVSTDNIIMIKSGDIAEGNEEDRKRYDEMCAFIRSHDMSVSSNYSHACNLIDIDSYVDYYALQIYIGRRNDWPGGNFALWRAKENDGSRYGDCKWRWMLFDENSYGFVLPEDTLAYVLDADSVFTSLYQSEEFRRKFAERLLYIGKEVFAPQKCNQFIDQYTQTLKAPLAASNKRFYMDEKTEEFEQYTDSIKTFFANRYDVVWNFLVDNMGEEWLSQNGIQK